MPVNGVTGPVIGYAYPVEKKEGPRDGGPAADDGRQPPAEPHPLHAGPRAGLPRPAPVALPVPETAVYIPPKPIMVYGGETSPVVDAPVAIQPEFPMVCAAGSNNDVQNQLTALANEWSSKSGIPFNPGDASIITVLSWLQSANFPNPAAITQIIAPASGGVGATSFS